MPVGKQMPSRKGLRPVSVVSNDYSDDFKGYFHGFQAPVQGLQTIVALVERESGEVVIVPYDVIKFEDIY